MSFSDLLNQGNNEIMWKSHRFEDELNDLQKLEHNVFSVPISIEIKLHCNLLSFPILRLNKTNKPTIIFSD